MNLLIFLNTSEFIQKFLYIWYISEKLKAVTVKLLIELLR